VSGRENTKNITVAAGDATCRGARMKAAALDTSVSALVKRSLIEPSAGETEFRRLERQERELRKRVPAGFRAADNLARDQVHERDA
jgi:hypothetical protein